MAAAEGHKPFKITDQIFLAMRRFSRPAGQYGRETSGRTVTVDIEKRQSLIRVAL
jgi:hypothetical protein